MDSSLGIIAVVLGAIALLLFLILKLKIHEVLALLIVSVVAGLAFGMSPAFVFETIEKGMGSTLGFLAVVIAIGSMFGEVMKISGGVQNLADTLYQLERLAQSQTWDEAVRNRNVDFGRLTFPRKNVDPELTERVKAARTACKKGLERKLQNFSDDSRQLLTDLQQSAAAAWGLIALVRSFDRDYSAAKRSRRVLDFGDLEHKTLELLLGKNRTSPTAAAGEVARRFREILVDEYQDSNGVQDAIFMTLSQERKNGFLVGDVKQSIYQFRLADPGIFLEKYREYVPAEDALPGQGRKVLLSHNFRSGAEVIGAVNDVFSACMRPKVGGLSYTQAEMLREGIPHIPLGEPGAELYALEVRENTYQEEADFVAQRVQTMLESGTLVRGDGQLRPVTPEDIVILLRSPGSAGSYFQRALESRGIRCTSGGGTDLLQTEEIGTFRSLLQVIQNPRQDIPLIAVLASPVFGFTADDLAAFRGKQKTGSVYDALRSSGTAKAEAFQHCLEQLRREARQKPLTVLLESCFALTRMDSIYAAMPGGQAKQANLRAFFELAVGYEQGGLRRCGRSGGWMRHNHEHPQVQGPGISGGVSMQPVPEVQPGEPAQSDPLRQNPGPGPVRGGP